MRQIGTKASAHIRCHVVGKRIAAPAVTLNPLLSVAVDGASCVSSASPAAYPLCWRTANALPRRAIAFDRTPPYSADNVISYSIRFTLSRIIRRTNRKLHLHDRPACSLGMWDEFRRYGLSCMSVWQPLFFAFRTLRNPNSTHQLGH